MPDHAVVEDEYCGYPHGDCVVWAQLKASKPRAVVAISEDRQWLVVLSPLGDKWIGLRWHNFGEYYRNQVKSQPPYQIPDTGQDAHEVLREWMEGRE